MTQLSQSDGAGQGGSAARPWPRTAKIAVSALLIWHLTAVLVTPLSVPPTLLGDRVRPVFRPYIAAMYLGNAYRFFAPDPGPSHLIRYELELADGSQVEGVFPNLNEHRPRQFYHRHFMLSEFVNSLLFAPETANEPDWTKWKLSAEQQVYAQSYADHLLHKHNARRATLYLQEHLIPLPQQVIDGMKLDDKRLYRERSLGSFAGGAP